ncbi:MAG TPA: methyltransferase domain-containing protein [Ilumatobacteraceae bacterium]|nr:methyltransferase domain-containing protein [Ilumatobacteraceae bacterium]
MGEPDTGAEWEANAPAWIEMSRAGADRYRDLVNTPAFLDALADMTGLQCLDVGCGEGHNTRLLVERGARITALDISETFIRAARDADPTNRYVRGDASRLPFADATFDAATAFMSIMDVADPAIAIGEIARVLRPGGWVQFSITHPVNTTPVRRWIDDEDGVRTWLAIGDYFFEGPMTESWTFKAAREMQKRHEPFTITAARRTVSSWMNLVIDAGLTIERVIEPVASESIADDHPEVADTRIVPFFLIVRARR